MTEVQEKMLKDVHEAVVGKPELGQEGIIPRVKKLEDYKEKDEKYKNRLAGGVAVGTVAATGVWAYIKEFIFK